jgi:DNA-binding response OmpR family regulator
MKVIIAEDDALVRAYLKNLLSDWGYEATVCETGSKAWERYLAGGFHLIISDQATAEISGLELCRRIRATSRDEHCYFILLSADRSDLVQELDSGVDILLGKPLDADELKRHLKVVESLITLRSGEDRLLPLCAWCRRTRIGEDLWLSLDTDSRSDFTYSICPHCSSNLRSMSRSNSNE